MRYRVLLHAKAEDELNALYDTITESAGRETAWNFVVGIRDFCSKLSNFPHRGTERVELMPGLRIIGYRRSVSIVFTIEADTVVILGIFYGGRNFTVEMIAERLQE